MTTEVDLRGLALDRGGASGPRRMARRHVLTRYLLPLGLIAGFLAVVGWASRDLIFPPKAVTVIPVFSSTTEIRQEGTPLFNAAGWIEPRPTPVRVAALAPGVVEELLVVENQAVRAGEPIAELIKDDAKLSHDRALADLELRHAELDQAEANLAAAETRLKQPVHLKAALGEAAALLAQLETQYKNLPFAIRRAEAELEAAHAIHDGKQAAKGVVAGVDIDIAKSKLSSAKAQLEELRDRGSSLAKEQKALLERRDALQTQLELLTDEIKARDEAKAMLRAASARVAQTQVALAETQLQLDRMTIRAPVDGRVYQLVAQPGANLGVGPGRDEFADGRTVVTLYRPSMLQVRVDVRFEDVPKVSLNQPVEIDNPALAEPLTGKVLFVSSAADIQKNTLQVKVEIPEPPPVFKPQMLVDVTFLSPKQATPDETPSPEMRLYVPQQYIHQREGSSCVWLADQSAGRAKEVDIETGTVGTNGLVEVTGGLNVSSRIITGGTDGLQDGDRITISGEDIVNSAAEPVASRQRAGSLQRLPTGDAP